MSSAKKPTKRLSESKITDVYRICTRHLQTKNLPCEELLLLSNAARVLLSTLSTNHYPPIIHHKNSIRNDQIELLERCH